ncbi:acyl carrier protein [Thiohalocapsa marina]|uniref:acyl carrier protein n=1 Tax=Thiohalocapsa marina TaxID=424902 RepID=UPI001479400A|nr:acyl carrier protein [Thiohalocapsa marina]
MDSERVRDEVVAALRAVAPEVDVDALDPEVNFRDQLELDSVDYLNFVLGVERAFGVQVPALDFPRLSCLRGCLEYLGGS